MKIAFLPAVLAAACLSLLAAGCGDDDNNTTTDTSVNDTSTNDTSVTDTAGDTTETDTVDPAVAACRAAIATKSAAVASQLATWSIADAPEMTASGGDVKKEADYAGKYRDDLANHVGCAARTEYGKNVEAFVQDNEAEVPAGAPADGTNLPGYDCAAKVYTQVSPDTTKPVVILVHGNSSSVTSFEEYAKASLAGTEIANVAGFTFTVDTTTRKQLAQSLVDAGYEVVAFDARIDTVASLTDYDPASATGNPFRNIDHGWAVPMLEELVKAVHTKYPGRKVSMIGHSLGVTVIRDALRRLYNESKAGTTGAINPFTFLKDVILLSGANHGVSNGKLLCDSFLANMKGTVGCEMGDRATFVPTYFTKPLNGPSDLFSAPCADGSYAFGEEDQCDGNVVQYTTVTMEDLPDGSLQDEFISEASSKLDLEPCVDNETIGLGDYDSSGYFFTGAPGFFANHFGTPRSNAGIALVLDKLAD
ncbi:MAG: alpha/beta hydrolase [Deltaproteobacteria bacterium]|nr:alpha/beta hydrolase [Deltaproteobacteria bacterium]